MGFFDLPSGEVYVCYEDGRKESVAFQDNLSKKEAERFKAMWEHKGKIVAVELVGNGFPNATYKF